MVDRLTKLFDKRAKTQPILARLARNSLKIKEMNDEDVRVHNLTQECRGLDLEVKEGITFGDVYRFACEYQDRTGSNILDEKIEDGHTLIWSGSSFENLINSRKMNKLQYACCEGVVDMMLSGDYSDYNTIRYLSVNSFKNLRHLF